MKGKYMTTQLMITVLSTSTTVKKDIHAQLAETIAERKRILRQNEKNKVQTLIVSYFNRTNAA